MKIGFIGLGIMGSRMAANLQRAGHQLQVYNRTRGKAEAVLNGGAVWAETPAQAASHVEVLFTMLSTPEVVRETTQGQQGLLETLPQGALWVDCSTVNPSFSREMAALASARGLRFMDAPVAGSRIPAEKGQLTFFVGGTPGDLEQVRPLFEVMGQKIIHAGGPGMGTSLKMVFNLLLAVSMAAFSEAIVLGEGLGLSRDTLLEILSTAAVVSPSAAGKKDKIAQSDFSPDFPLQWMQKDLHLASVSGYESGVSLPVANAAKEIYALAARAGFADQDFSAIYRFLSEGSDGR